MLCDSENYGGARLCHYKWVKEFRDECVEYNVSFVFCDTGSRFVKDGRLYKLEGSIQTEQAYKFGLSYKGKPINLKLTDNLGNLLKDDMLYRPYFSKKCETCSMKISCNGCSRCGKMFELKVK